MSQQCLMLEVWIVADLGGNETSLLTASMKQACMCNLILAVMQLATYLAYLSLACCQKVCLFQCCRNVVPIAGLFSGVCKCGVCTRACVHVCACACACTITVPRG